MVNLAGINSKVKDIKESNKAEVKARLENVHCDINFVNEYYSLTKLIDETKKELYTQINLIVHFYSQCYVPVGSTIEEVRAKGREMINNAKNYGLEDMDINHRDYYVDDNDNVCTIEFNSKERAIIISQSILDKNGMHEGHFEKIYSKQFDNTLDMINAYFDIVDSDYQLIKDIIAD